MANLTNPIDAKEFALDWLKECRRQKTSPATNYYLNDAYKILQTRLDSAIFHDEGTEKIENLKKCLKPIQLAIETVF